MTLVELLVATVVLSIVMTGLAAGVTSALSVTRDSRNRVAAANLAAAEMDLVRLADFASLPLGSVSRSQAVEAVTYTVTRTSNWTTSDGLGVTGCTGPSGGSRRLAYLRVAVSISWPDMGATQPVSNETVVTPPSGAYAPGVGNIAVRVIDRDGVLQAGHVVHADRGASRVTAVTDVSGCAFFIGLAPGAWTVSTTRANFVDRARADLAVPDRNTALATVTVVDGETADQQFTYDEASSLRLTLTRTSTTTLPRTPVIPTVPITLADGDAREISYTGTGTVRTLTDLFPYLGGYAAWAGCSDQNPASATLGGVQPPTVLTTPGAQTTGTVPLGTVRFYVRQVTYPVPTTNVAGTNVTVRNLSTQALCANVNYNLGSTASGGNANRDRFALLPFGVYRLYNGTRWCSFTLTASPATVRIFALQGAGGGACATS